MNNEYGEEITQDPVDDNVCVTTEGDVCEKRLTRGDILIKTRHGEYHQDREWCLMINVIGLKEK